MNCSPGRVSGFQVTRGGVRGARDPAPASPFLFPTGPHYSAAVRQRISSQGQCYDPDPGPRRGSLVAAVGGSITPASGEVGGSSREPPHGCLVPRRDPVLYPHPLRGFRSAAGTDLEAGLESEVRDATASSPLGGAGPLATEGV